MNKSEILFIYDCTNTNPNGDPDENRPRMDGTKNIVTDTRIKRTMRDYLHEYMNETILVREYPDGKGGIKDAKGVASEYIGSKNVKKTTMEYKEEILSNIKEQCIDARLDGMTVPVEKSSVTLTGAVQIGMGKSLNDVEVMEVRGTGAFASGEGKSQKTFRTDYMIPYSIIAVQGVINGIQADKNNLTNEDIKKCEEALWYGTANLITRSKYGQVPRFYIRIEYNDKKSFIGDLNNKINLKHDFKNSNEIRNINQYSIDITQLVESIKYNKDKISTIYYKIDKCLNTIVHDNTTFIEAIDNAGINIEELEF